jgi:hypothetical protein
MSNNERDKEGIKHVTSTRMLESKTCLRRKDLGPCLKMRGMGRKQTCPVHECKSISDVSEEKLSHVCVYESLYIHHVRECESL